MSISDYYYSVGDFPFFGNLFMLKVLQQADRPGGGASLLGSVVQKVSPIFAKNYPVPMHMSTPQSILNGISVVKDRLSPPIPGDVILSEALADASASINVTSKASVNAGVGPFPGLPLALGIDLDYDRVESITVTFGSGEIRYIPLDYLGRLYRYVKGNVTRVDAALDGNYVVQQVLLASNFKVAISSKETFDPSFTAKLQALNAIPAPPVGGQVSYAQAGASEITASVSGSVPYLVGLDVYNWDELRRF